MREREGDNGIDSVLQTDLLSTCVRVCVCERERDTETNKSNETMVQTDHLSMCVHVSACVCV